MTQDPAILSPSQQADYKQNGYLVLERFLKPQEVTELRSRMETLIDQFDPSESTSTFTTGDGQEKRDLYFLESGDKIRFFYEMDALDQDKTLQVDKQVALNKVGHALHIKDPIFRAFSQHPRFHRLAKQLGLTTPLIAQSMYIFKQPRIGGEVTWHQDATYLYTSPNSTTGFWFALEDANKENGCLWAIPGEHTSPLKTRYIRHNDNRLSFETYDTRPFDESQAQALEVPSGTLIVLNGLLPHMSCPNTSGRSRHAYALHLIDCETEYPSDNWLRIEKASASKRSLVSC